MKILLTPPRGPLHDLAQVLMRRSCRDPGEIPYEVLTVHDLVRVLVKRSCGNLSAMLSEALA